MPNAALRYTPPGAHREDFRSERGGFTKLSSEPQQPRPETQPDRETPPLAPGQKWDPSDKIKFVQPKRIVQRPGVVFVLNADGKAEARKVVLGITDGSATEIVSGELKSGDAVIIGDSTQSANTAQPAGGPGFGPFGFGGRGGGLAGGGPRGGR